MCIPSPAESSPEAPRPAAGSPEHREAGGAKASSKNLRLSRLVDAFLQGDWSVNKRRLFLAALRSCKGRQAFALVQPEPRLALRGLYELTDEGLRRLCGLDACPQLIAPPDLSRCYKFDLVAKALCPLPGSRTLSLAVDAFSL